MEGQRKVMGGHVPPLSYAPGSHIKEFQSMNMQAEGSLFTYHLSSIKA